MSFGRQVFGEFLADFWFAWDRPTDCARAVLHYLIKQARNLAESVGMAWLAKRAAAIAT
jgi:hypothetical protein